MKHSLFYKSRKEDFPWLEYSRDSVRKYVSGFDEIVLCLPEGQTFDWPEAKIVHVRESFNPYGFQQLCKLYADTWCSGDYITYQDSDTIWTKPVKPQYLIAGRCPEWPIRPFKDARQDQQVWRDVIRKYMKEEPQYEGMARHPFTVHRSSLRKLRSHCEMTHDCSLGDYIEQQFRGTTGAVLNFSEWNILAAFCLKYCWADYHWVDLSKESATEPVCWQGFSHGGPQRMEEDLAKFRELLGMTNVHGASLQVPPIAIEWNVDAALGVLKAEASQSPLHKARLMKRITAALTAKPVKATSPAKKRGRPPKPNPEKFILAIQSYPGGNQALERHMPFFKLAANGNRIAIITTNGGGCMVPAECEEVEIGDNSYISGDKLPRRLLGILEWFVAQPENLLCICEYDVLLPMEIKPWEGSRLSPAGGKLPNARASSFFHCPQFVDKEAAKRLIPQMHGIIAEGACNGPEASPDVFLSYAVDRAGVLYKTFDMFTRNTIQSKEDKEKARAAFRKGQPIHGVKDAATFEFITS